MSICPGDNRPCDKVPCPLPCATTPLGAPPTQGTAVRKPAALTIDTESPPGSWAEAIKTLPSQVAPIVPTDKWWAQRWIDKATPGELAAMRELLK